MGTIGIQPEPAGANGFEEVVHGGVEVPFGGRSGLASAGEPAEPEVVFGLAERGFGDMAALPACWLRGSSRMGTGRRRPRGHPRGIGLSS